MKTLEGTNASALRAHISLPFERLQDPEAIPLFERGSIDREIAVQPFVAPHALHVNVQRRVLMLL